MTWHQGNRLMLSDYCKNILRVELSKPDYDGMTVDQAWAWLTQPITATTSTPTGKRLTPAIVAGLIGPVKANAIASQLKIAFPAISEHLMAEGIDSTNSDSQVFIAGLVAGGVLTSGDAAKLAAVGVATTTTTSQARFDERFRPHNWPHVAEDGTIGTDEDKAIHGFPNAIERSDFDAAWQAAGKS